MFRIIFLVILAVGLWFIHRKYATKDPNDVIAGGAGFETKKNNRGVEFRYLMTPLGIKGGVLTFAGAFILAFTVVWALTGMFPFLFKNDVIGSLTMASVFLFAAYIAYWLSDLRRKPHVIEITPTDIVVTTIFTKKQRNYSRAGLESIYIKTPTGGSSQTYQPGHTTGVIAGGTGVTGMALAGTVVAAGAMHAGVKAIGGVARDVTAAMNYEIRFDHVEKQGVALAGGLPESRAQLLFANIVETLDSVGVEHSLSR